MPFYQGSVSVAAGATVDVLNNTTSPERPWKYNRAPYNGVVEIMCQGPATGLRQSITVGSDEVMQDSPVSAGGTINVMPSRLNREPVTFKVQQGDVISLVIANPTAGALTAQFSVELTRSQ
jgi:hypothetical protein